VIPVNLKTVAFSKSEEDIDRKMRSLNGQIGTAYDMQLLTH